MFYELYMQLDSTHLMVYWIILYEIKDFCQICYDIIKCTYKAPEFILLFSDVINWFISVIN